MNSFESLMSWIVKLVFILLLLPFAISFAAQLFTTAAQGIVATIVALLPWFIGVAVLIGLIAGISAGFTMRFYRSPRNVGGLPPGISAVKRPRQHDRDQRN